MSSLNALVWNTGGLNAPHKRASVLALLKRRNIDLALLSETHLLKADTQRLSNRFYHVIASSSFNSKTRGVAIVAKRNLGIKVLDVWADSGGRISIAKVEYSNRKIALVSAYAPNSFDAAFYNELTTVMLELTDYAFIVGADFNAVWDPVLDRSKATENADQKQATSALQAWSNDTGVTDLWRLINPSLKDFSFFSSRHKTFSRIDYLFASPRLFDSFDVSFLPIALSDHKGLLLKASLSKLTSRAPRWRFNTTLLKNDKFCVQFKEKLGEFLEFNIGSVQDPRILWDSVKGFIRSNCTLFGSNLRKERLSKLEELETLYAALISSLQTTYSDQVDLQIKIVKKEINSILRQQSEFQMHRTRQHYYFHSSRPSHLLAMRIRTSEQFADIPSIRTQNGEVTTDPKKINDAFRSFYSDLYKSEVALDHTKLEAFLSQVNLPCLTEDVAQQLAAPITLNELKEAVAEMQRGKAPGWDGIPPELYLAFWELLGPLLHSMIVHSIDVGSFSRDVNMALISLLLKKDKDPVECTSYRPLSLLGSDLKLFAKVLARRLQDHMTSLVHPDQTGFIRGRLATDNIRRLLHVIGASKDNGAPTAILSLDAMKAFDRLEWSYLWAVLEKMGVGEGFIHMIKVLYATPSAMILSGKLCSSLFSISRSSRQGCPLSPGLFALSLEPLAQCIRQSQTISPIVVRGTNHYLNLYADDVLLYVQNPSVSVPHLLRIIEDFGSMSGFKINWPKSAFLPLNEAARSTILPANIPVVEHFKYLGVEIFPSLNQTVNYNYSSLYDRVTNDLNRWSSLNNSLQARASIIKMNILPRVNFISSMLPLPPPAGYWKKLQSATYKFIWNNKRPRLRRSTVLRRKLDGGLGFPHLSFYFNALSLRPLITWFDPKAAVSWRPLEEVLVSPHRLQDIVYTNISIKQCRLRFGPLITHVIQTWRDTQKSCATQSRWHSHTPLFNNNQLLIGRQPIRFPQWENKGIHTLGDIYDNSGLRSFQDLSNWYDLPGTSFFFFLQIRAALKAHGVPWDKPLEFHPFHQFFYDKETSRGFVSNFYRHLLESSYKDLPLDTVWRRDVPGLDTEFDWDLVWENVCLSSRNPDHQQIHLNYVHRTYLTPRRLNSMGLLPDSRCTLCPLGVPGTFIHMYWECPPVACFWKKVATQLSDIFSLTVPVCPTVLLLNDVSVLPAPIHKKRLILAGLTAAKKLVAMRWKHPDRLSLSMWILTYLDVIYLEVSTARVIGVKESNIALWLSAARKLKERS